MALVPSEEAALLNPGLCSVTLRSLTIDDVVAIASKAGLSGIEWGTDIHVKDADSADRARQSCAVAGLKVLSLGSYCRAGTFGDFDNVLALALGAGAPRIRIWAGWVDPDRADQQTWDCVVSDTQRVAALAASQGLQIAFEFHRGTLTGTVEDTLALLQRVDRPNVGTYWQPAVGLSDEAALATLRAVLEHLLGVHCFSWWPGTERLPLAGRKGLWRAVADVLRDSGRRADVMLEFVEDDRPENVERDAAFLRGVASYPNFRPQAPDQPTQGQYGMQQIWSRIRSSMFTGSRRALRKS